MSLNLNSAPYYDDFDANKNYQRVLFKPGVAVQARELTQLQTILSDQLGQLSSYTLKDGAIISGCEERISSIRYIKITDIDANGDAISNSDLSNYVGATITGGTTGLKAQIIDVRKGTTNVGDSPNTKTLYINYNDRAGTNVKVFAIGETLTVSNPNNLKSDGSTLNGNTFVVFDSADAAPGSKERYEGSAPKIELSPGIIYARGNFIKTTALATYIDPFIINADKNIGFFVTENVIQSSDDTTLRDPASGSYNENAPGADRLQLKASLRSYDYAELVNGKVESVVPENFYQYATWRNGSIVRSKIKTNPLAGVGDAIARTAHNANGNYNITGLQTVIHEHLNDGNNGGFYSAAQGGDNSKFVFGITPGSANVGGYIVKQENKEWPIIVDKPTSTVTETSVAQSTAYGNYTLVDEFCGVWDVDGGGSVDLYDTAQDAVSGGTFSSTTILGNKIGSAKARFLKLDSGTAGTSSAQYRLYLYDIKMSSGTFKEVNSIVHENTLANGVADTVLSSAGDAVIQEGNYNRLVWELPYPSMKTLKADTGGVFDFDYKYIDEFDTSIDGSTGAVSLTSSSSQQTFFFGNNAVSGTTLTNNVQLLAVETFTVNSTTYAAGEYVDLTDSNITVTQTSETEMSIAFGAAPSAGGGAAVRVYVNMQYSNGSSAPISKSLQADKVVRIDTQTNPDSSSGWYSLGVADLLKIKSIKASNDSGYTTNAINVTDDFVIDNGQRDNYYGLAKIKQKSNSTVDLSSYRYLTVVMDFLTSSEGAGPRFACVDSYPSSLGLQEIPLYSPRAGKILDLRNCIDFRPYVVNTAVITSTEASATVNPSIEEEIYRPGGDDATGGLTNPVPTTTFNTDLEYYLAQAFKVIITPDGEFRVLTSQETNFPKFPEAPVNSLTIAKGIIPPFPSLSPKAANYYKRADLKVYLEQVRTKRYTMKDIGGLEERISNLEYYTSLSLLENEAKSAQILDTDGVDRFKNGLMIDAFNTYGVMAVGHDDNKCALDLKKQQLRASFDSSIVGFKPIASGTTAGQSADVFHIPYVEAVYTKQLQASKSRNVVTELLYADPETTNPTTADEPADPIVPAPPEAEKPVIPHKPVRPTEVDYYLVRSANTVAEGQPVTISLEVRNLEEAEGKTVAYEITGSTITAADLGLSSLSGNFTLDATGDSSLTLNVASDAVTEDEVITLTLKDSGGNDLTVNGSVISASITITNENIPFCPVPVLGPYGGVLNLVPSEDSWFDDSYAEPAYQNKEGSWDNLEIQGDWKETWGSWELVSEDIIEATTEITEGEIGMPAKGYSGTLSPTVDYETKAEGSGYWETEIFTWTGRRQLYDVTTTIAGQNTQTWERNGSRIFYGRIPDEITESIGDSVINSEVAAFVRPITINGQVSALMPNAQHNIVMGGILKGTLTTNAAGRANFSISVNKGEFHTGNILVEVSDSNKGDDVESYASSLFSANGTKRTLQTTYVTTKWSQPPVGAIPLQETKEVILPVGEDSRTMTKKGDVIINTVTETGDRTWVPVDDILVSSGCAIDPPGQKAFVFERYDGSTYTEYVPASDCGPADDVITISPVGKTLDTSTNTIVDDDVIVTEVSILDTAVNTNSNGGDNVVTVTLSNGAVLVADGLDEHDFVPGVTTTEGRYAMAYETAGIQIGADGSPYSVEINDVTSDTNLTSKVATATSFDKVPDFKLNLMEQFNNICLFDDPLAQTFFVTGMPGGMFVPSVDIFFKTISNESNNNGITLEIREVVNGYPSTTVVPNGVVHLRRSDIFASGIESDGSVKFNSTKFRFQNLVHLHNDTEYCVVLRPEANDPGYEVWVGELGQIQKNTTNRITKQAHGGVLFTSANNRTWTERQSEDLMFMVNRCKFETNTDYILNMTNKNTDWIVFDDTTWDNTDISAEGEDARMNSPKFDAQDFVHGFKITLDTAGSGYTDGTYDLVFTNTGTNGNNAAGTYVVSSGVVTTITLTNPGNGYTSAPTVALSNGSADTEATATLTFNRAKVKYFDYPYRTYELEVTSGSFATGDLVGNGTTFVEIASINNRVVDAHVLKCSTANAGEFGKIKKEISLTSTGAASANTTYSIVDTNSTVELKEEKTIYSYSNEVANYSSNKTAKLKFTISTPYNNLSPIIDIASIDMGVYKNKINNVSNEEVRFGGDADAKYISRQVVLADKQDAEDMRVFLDNAIPSGASVEVYGKFRSLEDDGEFANDIFWKKLEVETSPTVAFEKFGQYVYKIPAKGSSTAGTNSQGVFEYDVTRIDSIAVSAGGSGYSDTPPKVTITHTGNGYGAVAEAIVVGGVVTGIKIINPGRGYDGGTVSATISDGSGTGATAGSVTTAPVTFKTYKDFAIKIVHLSDNTARIPKTAGLRAYALQV